MAVLCALLGGCTPPILRMSSAFDGAPLGATLDTNPPPDPPEDSFVWVKAHTTSTLVKRPGTLLGGWARIAPNQSFLAAPEMREQVLLGYTERLTAVPPATLRGEVTVRLDGYGRLDFLLAAANTKNIPGDFLGGFVVDVPSLTPQSGVVLAVSPFSQERIRDISPLPSSGPIQPYRLGTVVTLSWTIDQASHILTLSSRTPNSQSQSVSYPAQTATDPIQKLAVFVYLQGPGPNTVAFVDDIVVAEI